MVVGRDVVNTEAARGEGEARKGMLDDIVNNTYDDEVGRGAGKMCGR